MTYVASDALTTRLREVLESGRGSARAIASGRFLGTWPTGLSADEDVRRALEAPRVRSQVAVLQRSPASPPVAGNLLLYRVSVVVTTSRLVMREAQLDPALYATVQARALDDADAIRQALEWPGNLLYTEAGEPTKLASGMLVHDQQGSQTRPVGSADSGAQLFVTTHQYYGTLRVDPDYPGRLTFSVAGTYTWTVPRGVTSCVPTVRGGGGGGGAFLGALGGGGGGGGGLGTATLALTPGEVVSIVVGAGGASAASGAASSVTALSGSTTATGGGAGGNATGVAQGAGGSAGTGTQAGGVGGGGSGSQAGGGGGGGGAGSTGTGFAGTSAGVGGLGGTQGGGRGADGALSSTGAQGVQAPGGGGGGASTLAAASAGARGEVQITW